MLKSELKVIAAEGEHKASRALRHAAEVIAESPSALQVNIQISSFMVDDDAAEVISEKFSLRTQLWLHYYDYITMTPVAVSTNICHF